ncbi:MAG: DUF493 family protein [Candidatus Eisenbacteria bacterium]|nr:DUF493 family protein [Candidatus Eisenbacteria bacterium]
MKRLPETMRARMTYPCSWSYRVIGADLEALKRAAGSVFGDRPVNSTLSNASRTGRYVSLKLVVRVESESERLAFYEALRSHPSVVLVI